MKKEGDWSRKSVLETLNDEFPRASTVNVVENVDTEASEKQQLERDSEGKALPKVERLKFWEIFKFSSKCDKCLVFFGIVCYMIAGALAPLYAIAIGEIFEIFDPNIEVDRRDEAMSKFTYWVACLCIAMMIFNSLSYGILQA